MVPHHCPVDGCTIEIASDRVMCLRHWRMLSKDIQNRIWHHERKRPGSSDHLHAIQEALEVVNAELAV